MSRQEQLQEELEAARLAASLAEDTIADLREELSATKRLALVRGGSGAVLGLLCSRTLTWTPAHTTSLWRPRRLLHHHHRKLPPCLQRLMPW